MRISELRRSFASFGAVRTLADLALRIINRVVLLHLVKAVALEGRSDRFGSCDDCDPDYRFCRLDEETLRRFTSDPGCELSEGFLRDAFARGDACYGFLRGAELAAYSWYTRRPTLVGLPGVELRFSDRWVHIYKGLTHPAHRGRRLHGRGMTKALALQLAGGARGLISYVDVTSWAARRSLQRAGYVAFGSVVVVRLFGRYLLWASPGCRRCWTSRRCRTR